VNIYIKWSRGNLLISRLTGLRNVYPYPQRVNEAVVKISLYIGIDVIVNRVSQKKQPGVHPCNNESFRKALRTALYPDIAKMLHRLKDNKRKLIFHFS